MDVKLMMMNIIVVINIFAEHRQTPMQPAPGVRLFQC